jgi:hypothetical protein
LAQWLQRGKRKQKQPKQQRNEPLIQSQAT